MSSKTLVVVILVLVALVVGAVIIFMQFGSQDKGTGIETGIRTGEQESSQAEQPSPETQTPPPVQPSVKVFVIEADDGGFYMNGADTSSISASSGENLKITFNVRTTNVYYGGLDFRGCGQQTDRVSPGGSTTVEFTATNTCTITSYWPSSSRVKDNLQVVVG